MDNKKLTANVKLVTTCVKDAQTWLDANTIATTEDIKYVD